MGLWSKFKKAVKKAVKKVKEVVEKAVDQVGEWIDEGVEAVGNAISDGLKWVGEKSGFKSIETALTWLGGVIKGVFTIVGVAVKSVFGIVGGVISGVVQIIGGIISLQPDLILDGLIDIISPIFGTILVVVGKVITLVQTIFVLQKPERPLTDKEKAQLKRVFKDTVFYYVIRVIEGRSGLFGINPRPFTLGNTIYLKENSPTYDLLTHEVTHVWQYQNEGVRYASDAIGAQWFVPDEYDWEKEINDRDKSSWSELNNEAQGQFLQDLWIKGELITGGTTKRSDGCFYDANGDKVGKFVVNTINHTEFANDAVETVRNGRW